MAKPTFTAYVELIHTLFDPFTQAQMDADAPHHRI